MKDLEKAIEKYVDFLMENVGTFSGWGSSFYTTPDLEYDFTGMLSQGTTTEDMYTGKSYCLCHKCPPNEIEVSTEQARDIIFGNKQIMQIIKETVKEDLEILPDDEIELINSEYFDLKSDSDIVDYFTDAHCDGDIEQYIKEKHEDEWKEVYNANFDMERDYLIETITDRIYENINSEFYKEWLEKLNK